jgi:ribonuclease R
LVDSIGQVQVKKKRNRDSTAANPPAVAASYRHPVPAPNELLALLREKGVPMTLDALGASLGKPGKRELQALKGRLDELKAGGQVLVNRAGEYCLAEKLDLVAGTVSAHRDGFGFLIPDEGSVDVYLSEAEMRSLLDGDRVVVRVTARGRGGRCSGTVVEILARARDSVVGSYQREHGIGWVVGSGRSAHHFLVPDRYRAGAQPGQLVKLEIMEYPGPRREAQGKIVRILGEPGEPRVLTEAAIEMFNLPSAWPAAVTSAAARFGTEVSPAESGGRVDLRKLPLVTIDGEDARDFDDAVFAEPAADGWRLIVAIADVSHYIRKSDAIDVEARRRGTSVYFPDRVVPMLPEALSNELCSLKPQVDRLCMVCEMQIDKRGAVIRAKFYRAVMHSHARLTYDQVDAVHRGADPGGYAHIRRLGPLIENLYGVYAALASARARRGALDLDLPETKIELDESGAISGVRSRLRNDAHRLIEECMIAANVEAARYLGRHRINTLYRVHNGPEGDKLEELRLLFQGLGVPLPATARTRPREINRGLQMLRDRPDFPMLATAVLRRMTQAIYQPANNGHFGLALSAYTHFTSPIRRYPDLLVHRAIGHLIDGGKPGAFSYDGPAMEQLGKNTSMLERRADEATRHVDARCKCLFMQHRVGEVVDGVVTGVTHFGLFVMLRELFVDGLIHVSNLPNDYYHLEPGGLGLKGEHTGRTFVLGEDLRVRVARVDPGEARIDLALESQSSGSRSPADRPAMPARPAKAARPGWRRRR